MTRIPTLATIAALSLAAAAAAHAQRGPGVATLYELPDFQGRSITLTGETPDLDRWRFNDRAQSGRFEGRWRICDNDDFKGRCQEVAGPVANLNDFGLFNQVSSLEPAWHGGSRDDDDRPGRGGGGFPPPGRDARGVDGARTVFFPRPSVGGIDVAAGDRGADMYCRRQGLGGAAWYDSSERAGQAVGPEGQLVGRSTVLRDLLCRKY